MWTLLMSLGLMTVAGPELDAARFGQLAKGLHDPVHDVEFVYEGGIRLGGGAVAAQVPEAGSAQNYQGRYRYRSDGAEFLDLYQKGPKDDSRQSHSLDQNLGGVASLKVVPDRSRVIPRPPPATKSKLYAHARPNAINMPGSPDRILFLWYFQGLTDPQSLRYEFQGWEDIDDHHCLRVELDLYDGGPPEKRDRLRMWIDMARGGHPLRVDCLREGRVFARSHKIRLQEFQDAKGVSIWLPVSGQFESFLWIPPKSKEIVYYAEPVLVESYAVVTGSVVLNQGLKDPVFSIEAMAAKTSDFKDFKGFQKPQPPRDFRTDPKGVQKRLDDALARADSVAERLEASADGTGTRIWSILTFGLPVLGIALLAGAGLWRWRAR